MWKLNHFVNEDILSKLDKSENSALFETFALPWKHSKSSQKPKQPNFLLSSCSFAKLGMRSCYFQI